MSDRPETAAAAKKFPLWLVAIISISVALSLPALFSGYMMDDYWYFDTGFYSPEAPFGYYNSMEHWMESDNDHWWHPPERLTRYFRPLASVSVFLDFKIWGSQPIFGHLQSVFWFVLLLLGAHRLLVTQLPAKVVPWAMAIFAFGEVHSTTLGWISARTHLMGGAFSVWSVYFYLSWRQRGARRDLVLSLLFLVLGLLTVEASVGVAAVLLAYELLGRTESLGQRGRALAPIAVLVLGYFIAYTATGHGVTNSEVYINPLLEPGRYLAGVVPKTFALLGVLLFGIPGMLRLLPGPISLIPLIAGVLGTVVLLAALYRARGQLLPEHGPQLRWLGLAFFLALIPPLASEIVEGREIVLPALAFAGVAGLALHGLRSMPKSWPRRILVGQLCFGLFFLSPLLRLGESFSYTSGSAKQAQIARDSKIDCLPGSQVLLINADFPLQLYAPYFIARYHDYSHSSWRMLVDPQGDVEVERSGVDSLTISSDKPLLGEMIAWEYDLSVGKVYEPTDLRATVLERTNEGTYEGPSKIEFDIPALEDRTRTCLLYFGAGLIQPATIPAMGEKVTVRHEMVFAPAPAE